MPAEIATFEPQRLTDEIARRLPIPAQGHCITYDTVCKRFGVRITHKGTRAYVLTYDFAGRRGRSITIGSIDAMTAREARHKATELKRGIDLGIDPQAPRDQARAAITVDELIDAYEATTLPGLRPTTVRSYRDLHTRFIRPRFGAMKIPLVTQADVAALHKELGDRGTKGMANGLLRHIRRLFAWAIEKDLCRRNPTQNIDLYPESPKERYLTPAEHERVIAALDAHPEVVSARLLKFLLLTGARVGETRLTKWSHIDMSTGVWDKPSTITKGAKRHHLVLNQRALALLTEMRALSNGSEYVFPCLRQAIIRGPRPTRSGKGRIAPKKACSYAEQKNRHLTWKLFEHETAQRLWKVWYEVRAVAGVPDVRIHDLRHTFASDAISAGVDLYTVSKQLNHANIKTTQRYAHLCDDTLRRAAGLMDRLAFPRPANWEQLEAHSPPVLDMVIADKDSGGSTQQSAGTVNVASSAVRMPAAERDWSVWDDAELETSPANRGILGLKHKIEAAYAAGDMAALLAFDFRGATIETEKGASTYYKRAAGTCGPRSRRFVISTRN
ncbi:MAG: tyrosine-type recombinase/integrase [Rhodopila sp.]|nr:tyrosine-type recombinase/integrase [Rhodopila sp.]